MALVSSSSSSSSSRNWVFDVFPSFSGEDVRITFLSHFLKEMDRKLVTVFKDSEIEKGGSLDPKLKQAIRDSRIAVVIFSKNYASSSWCLNELLEIIKCKEECGQTVIPVFYGLEPTHVRKQTGEFGQIFEETCKNLHKTEEEKFEWQEALTSVANILGYHSKTCGKEANMIEEIANNVLKELSSNSSENTEDFVGIEDHITKLKSLLKLESKEVRMVGIWGSSGIGKTTIARVLHKRLSLNFQASVFIDRAFASKSKEIYSTANPDDYNMKLHLRRKFLSQILRKKDIQIDDLSALNDKLKHWKVLIFIDDLDDQVVLDALVGQAHWFGSGSRIIVVTKNQQLLRAHEIDPIYEVSLPSDELALKMFYRYAFKKNSPPDDEFRRFSYELVSRAGRLPLGLKVLGSSLRGNNKEHWIDLMPRLLNDLDGNIEKTLSVNYEELDNKKDKALFRHIACLFNRWKVYRMKMILADSNLDVNIGLKNLVDKALVALRTWHELDPLPLGYDIIDMRCLIQDMGKEIIHKQSDDEPGEREFIVDPKDIRHVLENNTGTGKVLGISLNLHEIDVIHVHESAFKGMCNLYFLEISYRYILSEGNGLKLPENFDHLPPKLKYLQWHEYPMRCMPSTFRPDNLVMFIMRCSKLEKLWEGVAPLRCLKAMNLYGSKSLKEMPDLSMATNLETLNLEWCVSLVELPSSIRNLDKLTELYMGVCTSLKTLPTNINLKSLDILNLRWCSQLKTFPNISTNISELDLQETGIKEIPQWIEKFSRLQRLVMCGSKVEYVHLNISKLMKNLEEADFSRCEDLVGVDLSGYPSGVAMEADNSDTVAEENNDNHYVSKPNLNFEGCGKLDEEALLRQQLGIFKLTLTSTEMPSYFTHQTTGTSLTNIPLLHTSLSQKFFRFKVCVLGFGYESQSSDHVVHIHVNCRFKDTFGNIVFDSYGQPSSFHFEEAKDQKYIWDCCIPLNEDNAHLAQLNYSHVDMHIQNYVHSWWGRDFRIASWGIRLWDEKWGDNDKGTERSNKRMRIA